MEEINFRVDTCVAEVQEYIDAREGDTNSSKASITESWIMSHNSRPDSVQFEETIPTHKDTMMEQPHDVSPVSNVTSEPHATQQQPDCYTSALYSIGNTQPSSNTWQPPTSTILSHPTLDVRSRLQYQQPCDIETLNLIEPVNRNGSFGDDILGNVADHPINAAGINTSQPWRTLAPDNQYLKTDRLSMLTGIQSRPPIGVFGSTRITSANTRRSSVATQYQNICNPFNNQDMYRGPSTNVNPNVTPATISSFTNPCPVPVSRPRISRNHVDSWIDELDESRGTASSYGHTGISPDITTA